MPTNHSATQNLAGKRAIVTGGASGIGRGIAEVLARDGAHVIIADRALSDGEGVAAAMRADGYAADFVALDLSDEASIVAGMNQIVSQFGAPWALVNNAGLQDREALLDGTAAEWDRTHGVNARGAFLITREAARAMVAAGAGGRIVNIGTAALAGLMAKGHAPYLASKGALLGLSMASAFELIEHGITVNMVLPGGVMTPGAMAAKGPAVEGPAKRRPPLGFCEPQDMGHAVAFFVSPAAGKITSQTLLVDGGWSVT